MTTPDPLDQRSTWDDDERPPEEEDVWLPDPDAAPTVEGRVEQARTELHKLLRAAFVSTTAVAALLVAFDAWRGQGFANTTGFLFGAGAAALNLWLMGGGYFSIMRGANARSLLAFLGSFTVMVLLTVYVVAFHRTWTLGFALGLTTPALAGLVYGRTLR